ncbi:hypothetical protein AAFF_G00389450 [Aldrovandia affinis]|uniref:Uncharacterized protein n=1 Tax=Aldrovandia affinis TaxID=143900 RepID=A0AAD7SEG1_9TELE|nr:hypothetical protein AAFF_G00389450 [Aldrovandia affinis]
MCCLLPRGACGEETTGRQLQRGLTEFSTLQFAFKNAGRISIAPSITVTFKNICWLILTESEERPHSPVPLGQQTLLNEAERDCLEAKTRRLTCSHRNDPG